MRKRDVFGHRVNQVKFVYLMVIVFIAVLSARFILLSIQANRYDALLAQEVALQAEIDGLLSENESNVYHEIGEIIASLPNDYEPLLIANDLELAKNLAGLSMATNYQTEYDAEAESPFDEPLAASVRYIHISLDMNIDDATKILDFIDALLALDRLFYVEALTVQYFDGGGASISLSLYTFYNEVSV